MLKTLFLNVLTEDAGRFSIEAAQAAEFGYDVDARGANTYIPDIGSVGKTSLYGFCTLRT